MPYSKEIKDNNEDSEQFIFHDNNINVPFLEYSKMTPKVISKSKMNPFSEPKFSIASSIQLTLGSSQLEKYTMFPSLNDSATRKLSEWNKISQSQLFKENTETGEDVSFNNNYTKRVINKQQNEEKYTKQRFVSPGILCGIRRESRNSQPNPAKKTKSIVNLSISKLNLLQNMFKNSKASIDMNSFKKLKKKKISESMQWDYKGNEYSPNIISVETVEGHPQPESNQRVEFPKIIPVDYNSDDYYSGDSDSEYMMAIQGNSKELEKSIIQKKNIKVSYPKLNAKPAESTFKPKEPLHTNDAEICIEKSKSPKRHKKSALKKPKLKNKKLSCNNDERKTTPLKQKEVNNFGNA